MKTPIASLLLPLLHFIHQQPLWRIVQLLALSGTLGVIPAAAVTPTVVAEEPSLRSVDTVELIRNGLYWWTASSCTETLNQGGASQITYADPRLVSSVAAGYQSGSGSSGGFKPGDLFESGLTLGGAPSLPRGDLLPDCGYGAYFVRDDEAFYYTKNRTLLRKPFTASSFSAGEPITVLGRLRNDPVIADGALFATDTALYSYVADAVANNVTVFRTKKKGFSIVFEDVLTLQGLSVRKFTLADVVSSSGGFLQTEFLILTGDGRMYRSSLAGNLQLIRTGVADFAFRNERYTTLGPLGIPTFRNATTLYMALGNPITYHGPGRLVGVDLTPGARPEFVEYDAGTNYRLTSVAVDLNRIFLTRTPTSGQINSDVLSRKAPAKPTFTNPGDVDYNTIGIQREFRSLRSSGRILYFAHLNTVQQLPSDAPPIRIDFQADALEVTQGVQNLNNTVDLVTGKPILVRGYAHVADNTTSFREFNVPARLRVQRVQTVLGFPIVTDVDGSPFLPDQTPNLTGAVALSAARTNLATTYLFQLPASITQEGVLRFEMLLNESRSVPETGNNPLANNSISANLNVKTTLSPVLVFARMAYGGSSFDPKAPGAQFWEIINRATSMLPVAGMGVHMRDAVVFKPKLTLTGIKARSFDIPDNADAALMWLSIARTFDDNPANSHYVGMFPPGVTGFNGQGYNPGHSLIIRMGTEAGGGAVYNAPVGGRTLAHELSHNYGFNHIPSDLTCGTQVPDGPYDSLPNGASACSMGATDLEDPATSVGFDPISGSLVLPGSNGDLMSYTRTRWTSDYNWTRMLTLLNLGYHAFLPAPPLPSLAARPNLQDLDDDELLLVNGLLAADGASGTLFPGSTVIPGTLSPATLATLTDIPADLPTDYPVRLQLADAAGNLLVDQPAIAEPLSDGEAANALIQRVIPLPIAAATLRLVNQGVVLSEVQISANAPEVSLNPVVVGPATLDVSWNASDADGDSLLSTLQYSPDDGTTWTTLSIHYPESSLTLDTSLLPGGASARVRVITTDGIHSSGATSDPFEIAKHAPAVHIDGLVEGQILDLGSTVVANGTGYDSEDGSLAAESLLWTLSGPEARTVSGSRFVASALSPGTYQLALAGTDSDGNTVSQAIQFVIRPLAVADGPELVLDGLNADAAYAQNPRIRFGVHGTQYSTASFAHANGGLWICLTGLPYGPAGRTASAGVRVDTTGAGVLGSNAVGFAVDDQGNVYRVVGNGVDMVPMASPPIGLSIEILRDGTAWSAELRIADELLGGWERNLGMALVLDDGDTSTPPEIWPTGADLSNPSGWSPARAGALPPLSSDGNLLPYGDAEGLAGGDGSAHVLLPGWVVDGALTVTRWDAPGGFPLSTDPGPSDRGQNFLAGGPDNDRTTATTTVSLPASPSKIDAGAIVYDISAWLGGFQDQDDGASLKLSFLDSAGSVIDTVQLGPVTAADRGQLTGLNYLSATAVVPAGARSAQAVLEVIRAGGGYNDGYADNLRLVLREAAVPAPVNQPPAAVVGSDQVLMVSGGERIVLDGTASLDPEGFLVTYTWSQIQGPPLAFTDGDTASPSFIAPTVQTDTTFAFSLVVNDGLQDSLPATTRVTLQPPTVQVQITILSIDVSAAGGASLQCAAPDGRAIQLERCLDLATPVWEPVGEAVISAGGNVTLSDPGTEPLVQAFYRAVDVTQ